MDANATPCGRAWWLGQRDARSMMRGEFRLAPDTDELLPRTDNLLAWFGYPDEEELPAYLVNAFNEGARETIADMRGV